MPSIDKSKPTLRLTSDAVVLVASEFRRPSFERFDSGTAEIAFSVDFNEQTPLEITTRVNLTLIDTEAEKTLFTGMSEYLIKFESDDDVKSDEENNRDLVALALRITFPFHRATISSAVAQVGLPPYHLPLVTDEEWLGIVDKAAVEIEKNDSSDS